jgi:hypothetical protein
MDRFQMKSQDCCPGRAEEQNLTDRSTERDAPDQSPLASPFAQKKPSDRCEVTGETPVPGSYPPDGQNPDASRRSPRAMPRPVSLKGRMTPTGYEPENCDWLDVLTHVVDGHRVGRDPLTIQPDVLTAAGHGPRRTRSIIAALGDEPIEHSIVRHKDLRKHCLDCSAGSKAEVRRCAIINCPLWSYRLGGNPHSPKRGRNPFAKVT